jgi:hypothetical protein
VSEAELPDQGEEEDDEMSSRSSKKDQESSSKKQSAPPSKKSKSGKSDDWAEVTEPEERRRIQNRIAQRKFRESLMSPLTLRCES